MSYRTQVFNMLPWVGGYNTSVDPSLIGKNQLTKGENIVFDTRGSRKQRPAINYDWDDATSSTSSILGLHDFWYGSASKSQLLVSLAEDGSLYSYSPSTGARTLLTLSSTSTVWASVISTVSFETFNNKLIVAVDGSGNKPMRWSGTGSYENLPNAPEFSVVRQHLGRLWTNDKTNRDRLHYSETFNEEVWNGSGDSGALDIGKGDGDPDGIVAIFPSFKGVLFVAKRTKLYRVSGHTPDDFNVELVSSGIGCVSHNSACLIDQDDLFFVSERGLHSIVTTSNYGDFQSNYVSSEIQRTFNDRFVRANLAQAQGAYFPSINSYALAVTDSDYSSTENKAIWLFNIPLKAWYLWPDISCQALSAMQVDGRKIPVLGSSTKRVAIGFVDSENDTNESGTETAILFSVATGFIFPADNIYVQCAFKKLGLSFTPTGSYSLTLRFQIDTQEEQVLTLSGSGGEVLDVDFVLDQSVLQPPSVMEPQILSIDGYGRSFKLSIEQASTNKDIEIQGFHVEWELMGPQQEVLGR